MGGTAIRFLSYYHYFRVFIMMFSFIPCLQPLILIVQIEGSFIPCGVPKFGGVRREITKGLWDEILGGLKGTSLEPIRGPGTQIIPQGFRWDQRQPSWASSCSLVKSCQVTQVGLVRIENILQWRTIWQFSSSGYPCTTLNSQDSEENSMNIMNACKL